MHCVKERAISKWVARHVEKLSGVGWWEQWAGRRGHSGVGCRAAPKCSTDRSLGYLKSPGGVRGQKK